MREWTVSQLAQLAGISVRALHHYDEIGLLTPARNGENGYRYYGEKDLLRLQQILLYREMGVPLSAIRALLDDPRSDSLAVLRKQRAHMRSEAKRYRQLVRTIDRTIAHIEGERAMKHEELYSGFVSPEKQSGYRDWLLERFGESMREQFTATDSQTIENASPEMRERMAELAEIEAALVQAMKRGEVPEARALDPLLERHRDWVQRMWAKPCSAKAYAGLADIYESHPDFIERYETLGSGFSKWLPAAMRAWARRVA